MHRKLAILSVLFILAAATLPTFAQQAEAQPKAYTPTFGEWVHIWTKANLEQLYRITEMQPGRERQSGMASVSYLRGMTPAYQITVISGNGEPFEQWKQQNLPILEAQVKRWQVEGMDVSMDDFRIVQKNPPGSKYRIRSDLQSLNTQTQLYKFKTGNLPESLDALVKEGYLHEVPDAAGGKFVLDKDFGVWSHVPGEKPQVDDGPKPATPQQLDRWNKSYTPTLGEWAFVWTKTNFETLQLVFEMEASERADEMTREQREAMAQQIGLVFVVRHAGQVPGIEIRIATGSGQDDAPFYVEWMKTQKPLLEAQVKQWQAAGLDISMDDFIITHQSYETERPIAENAVPLLNSQTELFKFENNGALPKSLEELVEAGLMVAPDPAGGKYVMDKAGKWSYEPPAEQKKDERFVEATPQQLDRLSKSVTPDFDDWAYAWVRTSIENLYQAFVGAGDEESLSHFVFVTRPVKTPRHIEIHVYAGDGTPMNPDYEAWLKETKPLLEEQVVLWRAAGMDVSMDDIKFTLKANPEARRDEEMEAAYQADIESNVSMLNSQTALFRFKNNRLPKGAEELVKEGYLQAVPEPPKPGKYVMDEEGQWSFEPAGDKPEEKAPATQPAAAEDVSDEKATKTAESLGKIVKLFKAQKGRLPKSLNELVEQDYIPAIPQAPQGKAYRLDAKLGLVDVVDAENATPKSKTFKPLSQPERLAAKSDLVTMKTQMQLFKFKEQRWPKNLQELVDTGLMQNIPDAPGGREWLYDPETGEVRLEGEDL